MKPTISELSYAFALTEDLVKRVGSPLISAPFFPSTAVEGKKGFGHDVKISAPSGSMFLQFKLSHCMSNASAMEFHSGKFSQYVGGVKKPVYRMYLHALAKSRQTSLMLKLEQRHGNVHYVAPLFHTAEELTGHYLASRVVDESRFIKPSKIKKMPDQLEHFVSFRKTGKPFRFSNDPVELEDGDSATSVVDALNREIQRGRTIEVVASEALESMLAALDEERNEGLWEVPWRQETVGRIRNLDIPILSKASYVAYTYFDAQFLAFARHDG